MDKVSLSSNKLKNKWEYAKFSFEKYGTYGFSWPKKNYSCSFCKKEFKSAQALGGHMNIHRRERAKMRQPPSGDYPNRNPNPNPNFFPASSSSSAAKFLPYKSCQSSQNEYSEPTADEKKVPTLVIRSHFDLVARGRGGFMGKSLNKRAFTEVTELQFLTKGKDSILWKKKEIVKVDLNMSFLRVAKNDVDLELRLGHSK